MSGTPEDNVREVGYPEFCVMSQDSSVITVTRLNVGHLGFDSHQAGFFLHHNAEISSGTQPAFYAVGSASVPS